MPCSVASSGGSGLVRVIAGGEELTAPVKRARGGVHSCCFRGGDCWVITTVRATTCVLGVLSAFLVSRCQRGREFRDLCFVSSVFCVCVFAFSFEPRFNLVSIALGCFPSYGVRHMHSIYLSELVIYCSTFVLCSCLDVSNHVFVSKI